MACYRQLDLRVIKMNIEQLKDIEAILADQYDTLRKAGYSVAAESIRQACENLNAEIDFFEDLPDIEAEVIPLNRVGVFNV